MSRKIPASHVQIKRAYDAPARDDGARILVDRLWPRGVKKDALKLDRWAKELAPSAELRQWFDHDAARWEEFQQRYAKELNSQEQAQALHDLRTRASDGPLTLVYGAHDEAHNNAVVLRNLLLAPVRS